MRLPPNGEPLDRTTALALLAERMADDATKHIGRAGSLLKLDYDGRQFPPNWMERLGFVARENRLAILWVRIDRTKRGWHLTAQLSKRVAPLRLVLLQALCGSDYRRETFNGVRAGRLNGVNPFWRERFNQLFTEHFRRVEI